MGGPAQRTNFLLLGCLIALATAFFILHLFIPLGIAVGMLYIVPILASLWLPRRRYTNAAALAGTVLTVVGVFFSEPPATPGPKSVLVIGLLNDGLTLILIWATAILVLLYKRAEEQIKTLEGLISICSSCKKIRDDRGNWDILERYIQKHSEAQFTHGMCPECLEQFYRRMHIKVE
jgi:uncharacterized membrane protein YccC